jgi:hypothetical protein
MGQSRAGRVVAIVLGCIILYAGLCVWAVRHYGTHKPRPARSAKTAPAAKPAPATPVDVVGKSVRAFDVTTADGGTLRIPDGKRSVALWLGDASQAAQAAGGFKQLAGLLPQVQFVIAASGEVAPSPGVAFVTADAAKVSKTLGEMLGTHQRQSAEWWLIDANGRVQVFGEPGPFSPIMEADLAWPFLRDEVATPTDFTPTPVAKLCPDGANRRWRDRCLELWRHRLLDAYRQWGHHGAAWDDTAVAFLEQRCRVLARHDTADGRDAVVALAEKVLAKGCADPMVVYECGLAYVDGGLRHRGTECFGRALDLVDGAHYPARSLYPLGFLPFSLSVGANADLLKHSYERFGESLAEEFAPGEQRLDEQVIAERSGYGTDPASTTGFFQPGALASLRHPGADLWIRALQDGAALLDSGWRGSGGGYVAATPQFVAGHKSLALAWKLHPDYPEAAERLVGWAMAQPDKAGSRLWTERALAADINSQAAEVTLLDFWPRNGGTHEQMKVFAAEMASDELLTTDAPLMMWRAQVSMAEDLKTPFDNVARGAGQPSGGSETDAPFHDAAAIDATLATLDKMIAAAATPQRQARLRSYRLAVLARCGRDQQAGEALAQLGDKLDLSGLTSVDTPTRDAFGQWLLDHELGQEAVAKAAEQIKARDYAGALATYEALRPKAKHRPVQRWLDESEAALADFQGPHVGGVALPKELQLGNGFVSLPIDSDFSGWGRSQDRDHPAKVSVDAGGMVVYEGRTPLTLSEMSDLAANVEVALEVHIAGAAAETALFKFEAAHPPMSSGPTVTFKPDSTADASKSGGAADIRLESRDWHTLRLRVKDGVGQAVVDGKEALPPDRKMSSAAWHFSMNLDTGPDGEPIKIRGMQWRAAP